MRRCLGLLLLLGATSLPAQQPAPAAQPAQPQRAKNLKVLPADMPLAAVRDTMRLYARALGVRCSHCHVSVEGAAGQPPQTDYASDDKVEKEIARHMMRMTRAINTQHIAPLPSRVEPNIAVGCATCHRGLTEPRQLADELLLAYQDGGIDRLQARYDSLRARYYGQASYDFGDAPLGDVAQALRARDRSADAMKVYLLNVKMSPASANAHRMLADAQLAARDTAAAVASLEKVVQLAPNDPQARRQLDALRRKP
ncbi:c-type cytochrome [Roseisolibacter sp. H3M3-2]|uniref:c-type cytochrome n=1 Tax=Roseisolibacter sp. H3M3-2 TaxID=3031323 RepID=UPI0023D9AECB|nr:c-type cytochrome [Roseisolibacter sp. H3M3-2]MDF1506005.1 c-type cytochrome [Roseisolibacter sp. H3M3-2]